MNKAAYITVILPLKLEWEPFYTCKEEDGISTGDRVSVLFSGKEYIGVVSEVRSAPPQGISGIREIISHEPMLEKISAGEITLWRHVASYYMCTVGEVYKAAYPSHKVNSEEIQARKEEREAARAKAALEREEKARARMAMKSEKLNAGIEATLQKVEKWIRLRDNARTDSIREKYTGYIARAEKSIEEMREKLSLMHIGNPPERISDCMQPVHDEGLSIPESGIVFNSDQQKAYSSIRQAFSLHKPVLLNGVTGSGKTEIYIRLAEECLAGGKNVLYLIPEIAIGKQIQERLQSVFGEKLLTFHSGESMARRGETAAVIRSRSRIQDNACTQADGCDGRTSEAEHCYIALGTRSALFLPHSNLGLIIVDEEQDSSYKQDSPAPRYNGRDVAVMLASIHGADIILGSATPSLESLYNCKTGKYTIIRLDSKYYGDSGTDVEIIDTIAERKKRGMRGNLSLKLILRIRQTLGNGEQVIILRSRRSYSPSMQCSSCGFIPKCPKCNISLSYHSASGKDICHYCGYSRWHARTCPECGGEMTGLGAGTQKIEEELSAAFPEARIARLDSDSAKDRKYETEIIRKFSSGEIDILVGTQMVTKGFDFSRLSLVAVIGSDSLLAVQDFRADEKAVQTLMQFKGRCGRRGRKGLFIIQTCQPQHPVYRQLEENDGHSIYASLLDERSMFGYPPFRRLIDLYIKDIYEDRCIRMAGQISQLLASDGTGITGPYCPPGKPRDSQKLMVIRISLEKDMNLKRKKERIRGLIAGFEKETGYAGHIYFDVDPC